MKTQELINEAFSLPTEERALMVDLLLKSLNSPESEIEKKWSVVAIQRLNELRSGKIISIPGKEVFTKIWTKFEK